MTAVTPFYKLRGELLQDIPEIVWVLGPVFGWRVTLLISLSKRSLSSPEMFRIKGSFSSSRSGEDSAYFRSEVA
jgi:hypothetical protein